MTDVVTNPIELASNVMDGDAVKRLYEALCRRGEVGWLRFHLSSESSGSDYEPRYKLTAQWCKGPDDPPQPGPRADLVRQIDWVRAFVAGWLAAQ